MGMDGDSSKPRSGSRGKPSHPFADFPKPSRSCLIVGLTRRAHFPSVLEILAGNSFNSRGRGQVDTGFGAALGFGTEGAGDCTLSKGNAHIVGQELRSDHAGMQTVD